ncbi:MAG: hypothetical protein ACLFQ1_00755 [Halochromatium sp.]|uniref:type IV pilus modification PilV family protein n=1 Tax=Halochromatium sp. TaxID=2049430 RepID=UPI003979C226
MRAITARQSVTAPAFARGFGLVEALIALVVLSVGVLGIARLNARLLQEIAPARVEAEAMQLAQTQFALARFQVSSGTCTLTDETSTVHAGETAEYRILRRSTDPGSMTGTATGSNPAAASQPAWLGVEVKVCWPRTDAEPCAWDQTGPNEVVVKSLISCDSIIGG